MPGSLHAPLVAALLVIFQAMRYLYNYIYNITPY